MAFNVIVFGIRLLAFELVTPNRKNNICRHSHKAKSVADTIFLLWCTWTKYGWSQRTKSDKDIGKKYDVCCIYCCQRCFSTAELNKTDIGETSLQCRSIHCRVGYQSFTICKLYVYVIKCRSYYDKFSAFMLNRRYLM